MDAPSRLSTFSPRRASPKLIGYLSEVEQLLTQEIATGQITIGVKEQNICDPEKARQKACSSRLKQIKQLKQQMLEKISDLAMEQNNLKKLSRIRTINRHERSFFTEEDRMKISMTKKAQREHGISINEKIKAIMSQVLNKEKQEKQEKQFQMDCKKKERVMKLVQKRHKTEHMNRQQSESLEKSPKKLSKKNYTYFRNLENDAQLEKQRQKYESLLLQERKERSKIDFEKLKEHSKMHDQILAFKKKEYQLSLHEEIKSRVKSQISVPQTQFMRKVKQEQLLNFEQRHLDNLKKKQIRERMKTFGEEVKANFKPKSDSKSKFVAPIQLNIPNPSSQKRLEKGNQYLREARKLRKKISPEDKNLSEDPEKSIKVLATLSEKYPNYISDVKEQNRKRSTDNLDVMLKQQKFSTLKAEKAIKWVKTREEQEHLLVKKKKHHIQSEVQSVKDKMMILSSLQTLDV